MDLNGQRGILQQQQDNGNKKLENNNNNNKVTILHLSLWLYMDVYVQEWPIGGMAHSLCEGCLGIPCKKRGIYMILRDRGLGSG